MSQCHTDCPWMRKWAPFCFNFSFFFISSSLFPLSQFFTVSPILLSILTASHTCSAMIDNNIHSMFLSCGGTLMILARSWKVWAFILDFQYVQTQSWICSHYSGFKGCLWTNEADFFCLFSEKREKLSVLCSEIQDRESNNHTGWLVHGWRACIKSYI